MHILGRILLAAVVLLAPWPFGGVTPQHQWMLCLALTALVVWRFVEALLRRPDQPLHVPLAVIAPVGLLLLASGQLLPRDHSPIADMQHAVFGEWADSFPADAPASGSVSPVATREQASRLFFALAAFLLAAQWFSEPGSQIWLWRVLALNGAALAFFAIVQKLTWNGLLYWSVPLRFGGTPFATFVNRNNAAGYFNLCLAAGIGWFFFRYGARLGGQFKGALPPGGRVGIGANGPTIPAGGQRLRSRLPLKVRLLRAVAAIEGADLALLGLLAVTVAAVLFSLSRGGVCAMIAGLGVTIWRYRGLSRTAAMIVVLLLGASAAGLMLWVGGWGAVEERLTSLSGTVSSAENRLAHWKDTSAAVRDFPLLGTGLGTYRYANLPYQRHQGDAWYVNADNHYFEMLVETGVVGLVLFVSGFLLTGLAAGFLARSERPELRAAGLTGLFAVSAQMVQATTDFGLLIPANGLTFAVIAGAVCGTACTAAGFERIRLPLWLSVARLEGRLSLAAVNLAVAVLCGVFALEMFAATTSAAARRVTIAINPAKPQDTPDVVLAQAIENAEAALPYRPDDPELHRSIALWWISRYRLATARELHNSADPAWNLGGRRLWRATSLTALSARVASLMQANDRQQAEAIRDLPLVQEYLVPARNHLLQAAHHGPLTRDVSENLARLAFLVPSDDTPSDGEEAWQAELTRYARQSLFVTPSAPDKLLATGLVLDSAGLQALADDAFSRCLKMSDLHLLPIWQRLSAKRPLADLLQNVIPPHVDCLVSLAERVSDEQSRRLLTAHAEHLLQQGTWEDDCEPSARLRARLAELAGQFDQAIALYRSSLSNDPWSEEEIETRLRIAQLLKQEGRLTEAESEFSLLRHLAPHRSDIQKEFETLRLRDLGDTRQTFLDTPHQNR